MYAFTALPNPLRDWIKKNKNKKLFASTLNEIIKEIPAPFLKKTIHFTGGSFEVENIIYFNMSSRWKHKISLYNLLKQTLHKYIIHYFNKQSNKIILKFSFYTYILEVKTSYKLWVVNTFINFLHEHSLYL